MDLFCAKFTSFVNRALRVLFMLILVGSIALSVGYIVLFSSRNAGYLILVSFILFLGGFGIVYFIYRYFKLSKNHRKTLIIILVIAFLLRVMWVIALKAVPYSDFLTMYNCGRAFISGDYSGFKGISYIARFSHLTILTIYLGAIQGFFSQPIMAYQLINAVLSTFNVFLIYLIASELYDNRDKGIWAALAACLFPAFIAYNSVPCSENMALPFFLGSVYMFMMVIKTKKSVYWMLLSGLLLSVGNLFRMVAYVMIVAYVMYLIIYWRKNAIKSIALILLSFFIPLFITNAVLINSAITEYPLWKGREPSSTSILKGTNIMADGGWNLEDSKIPEKYNYDYKAVDKAAKAIIKQRLTTTPLYKLAAFYIVKFDSEWSVGDFSGVMWATGKVSAENAAYTLCTYVPFYAQIFYVLLMVLVYKGLFNKKQYMENKLINLFYIIFCGYGLLYLITEQQARYAYIVCWIFIILAFSYSGTIFKKDKIAK